MFCLPFNGRQSFCTLHSDVIVCLTGELLVCSYEVPLLYSALKLSLHLFIVLFLILFILNCVYVSLRLHYLKLLNVLWFVAPVRTQSVLFIPTDSFMGQFGFYFSCSTVSLPSNAPLQEVPVPVIGNRQCSCDYFNVQDADITSSMICAGQENRGVCQVKTNPPVIEVELHWKLFISPFSEAAESYCVSFIQLEHSSVLGDKN